MSRYTGPRCRLCRREAMKLFLKGTRCYTVKCPIEKKDSRQPGMHLRPRRRLSDYGIHMREKQRAKRFYGLSEAQFRRYYARAARMPGNTGEILLQLFERRLDNIIFRMGMAPSRALARQMILHGHVAVNGRRLNVASAWLKPGDTVAAYNNERAQKFLGEFAKSANRDMIPSWLQLTSDTPPEGRVLSLPTRQEVPMAVNEQLIVELCSK